MGIGILRGAESNVSFGEFDELNDVDRMHHVQYGLKRFGHFDDLQSQSATSAILAERTSARTLKQATPNRSGLAMQPQKFLVSRAKQHRLWPAAQLCSLREATRSRATSLGRHS